VKTRWDELAAPFDALAAELRVDADRELLARIVQRCGWGARGVDEPRLPSGVRHGVPWGLSVARTEGEPPELRVFLEAQCAPPTADGYWTAAERVLDGVADLARVRALGRGQRMWHAIGFARGRPPVFHAYVCVPETPQLAWDAVDADELRDELGPRARVTIVSRDLHAGGRTKLYAIVPDALVGELPWVRDDDGTAEFARVMLGEPRRIGWLVAYQPATRVAALHFGALMHGDPRLRDRLDAYAPGFPRGPLHFVSFQRAASGAPRVTVYYLPEAAP
jgi:hypothetical protein